MASTSLSKTPAPKSERIYGSKVNKADSAASKKSAKSIVLSDKVTQTLKDKAEEYNKNHSDKVTLNELKAVFRRGSGAYSTSHRPTITDGAPNSRNAWSFARVNKFLEKKAGKKVKAAYVQDDDLLEKGGEIAGLHKVKSFKTEEGVLIQLPKELIGRKYVSNTGFGGERMHTSGKVWLEDLKVQDNGIENARNTISKDKSFKPSKKPITVGVDILTGEKLLLDGYHRYVLKKGISEVNAKFIPMRNGEIIEFENIVDSNPTNEFEEGGEIEQTDNIALPDTYSTYDSLKPILENQGYDLIKKEPMETKTEDIAPMVEETVPQEVICVGCGWQWDAADSGTSDMYVCHQCGFDNTLFRPTLSIQEIAEKHGVELENIIDQIIKGTEHEIEHTNNPDAAKVIAMHHIAETNDYYDKLEEAKLEDGAVIEAVEEETPVEIAIIDYLNQEKEEALDVMSCTDSRVFKAMICKTKIEVAEKRILATDNPEEQNCWNEVVLIWKDCLTHIIENTIPERKYKEGGQPCGCGDVYSKSKDKSQELAKGGLAYGNSHDNGGIPAVVKSTGQHIEFEGAEGVVNKRSMQMDKKVEFEGKKMTPCEVISKINQMGGGVKFNCSDVKEIVEQDGEF
jgi:predicted DNA-binding protein YlxM (UPF0122 family)